MKNDPPSTPKTLLPKPRGHFLAANPMDLKKLEERIRKAQEKLFLDGAIGDLSFLQSPSTVNSIPVITSPYVKEGTAFLIPEMPKLQPLRPKPKLIYGILCPDGEIRTRKGFLYKMDRFTWVEESDLPWLLGLRIMKEIKPPSYGVPPFIVNRRMAILASKF